MNLLIAIVPFIAFIGSPNSGVEAFLPSHPQSLTRQTLTRFASPTSEWGGLNLPGGWYGIALSDEVKGQPISMERMGIDLALWRNEDGSLNIFEDRCPHRLAKLSRGKIVSVEGTSQKCLQCPFHGLLFDSDGKCQHDPEDNQPKPFLQTAKFTSVERDGVIYLKWGDGEYPEPDYFEGMDEFYTVVVKYLSSGPGKDSFRLNVEAQLDSLHPEFVHTNSFWRFAKNVIQDQKAVNSMDSNRIRWHFKDPGFYWEFVFPNVWSNPLGTDPENPHYVMSLIYAPINETSTLLYIRSHRNFMNIPGANLLIDTAIAKLYEHITFEDQEITLDQQKNVGKYGAKDIAYRQDDVRIRHFRRWLEGKYGALYNRPSIEAPKPPENP